MTILVILLSFWGFMFLLSLALVTANSRRQIVDEPTTAVDFNIHPHLLTQPEALQPLAEIVAAKVEPVANFTSTERRARRLAGTEKTTVFVVDDDPDILNLIKHVLSVEGFEVRSFTDPEEALEEFASAPRRPEMMVTDYCMQPMNGLELISRCRESAPDLKTILISGMVSEDVVAQLPEKSDRFIHKPFKVANLVQTMNDTLAEARN